MKAQTWIIVTLILITLAALLQVGGVAAPMWVWLQNDNEVVGVGLFYRVGCEASSGAECPQQFPNVPFNYTDTHTRDMTYWVHLTWLQTLAAGLTLFLVVMMVVYLAGFGAWKSLNLLNTAMVVTALFAWLCITVGLILFVVYHGLVISRSPDVSRRSFPWSALMCFLAGILLVLIAMLVRCRCRQRRYTKGAIPTSADSKMALNPSTRGQMIRRFFTPSPYREDRRKALQGSAYTDQSQLLANGGTAITTTTSNHRTLENGHALGFENRGYQQDVVTANHRLSEELPTPLVRTGSFQQQQQQQQQQGVVTTTTTTSRLVTEGSRFGAQNGGPYPELERNHPLDERRIHASQVVLDRHVIEDGFREQGDVTDDADTIFYTGRGQQRTGTLYVDTGLQAQDEVRRPSRLQETTAYLQHQNVVENNNVLAPALSHKPRVFRIGAVENMRQSQAGGVLQELSHTRIERGGQWAGGERIILSPGQLESADAKYSSTHIYRPYSEQLY